MKNKIYLGFMLILMFLIMLIPVNAMIIEDHVAINRIGLSKTQSSIITQEILEFEDYFHMGNIITDISVVFYFTLDAKEDDNFFQRLFKIFTFRIGKKYRATHAQNVCKRALAVATTPEERVTGYGICAHLMQDTVSHNKAVPKAIEKTGLFNGLIHSIKEIHDKDLFVTAEDHAISRQVLDLAYDMTPYLERVYVGDPAFSDVKIAEMVDLFVTQVQPNANYQLGFRSFFALPTYIYWIVLLFFLLSFALLAFTARKIFKDKEVNVLSVFTFIFALIFFALITTAIVGLLMKNIWRLWEIISQFVFSPLIYPIAILLLIISLGLVFQYIRTKNKLNNIPNLLVAVFIFIIATYLLTLPTALSIGNENDVHNLAVENTVKLLNEGTDAVLLIEDPVGFEALKKADASGKNTRTAIIIGLLLLISAIIFFTFKGNPEKNQQV